MGIALVSAVTTVVICAAAAPGAHAQAKKPRTAPKKPNTTVTRAQMVGGNGRFGVVYSLKDGFNVAILAARYQVTPLICQQARVVPADGKLFVADMAIKNVRKDDNYFSRDNVFTLVDQSGRTYNTTWGGLASLGARPSDLTLRPGQGVGQKELKDPLRIAVVLPGDSRVVKIMLRTGRVGTSEETVRYYIAGATKQEAGEAGDPANVVAPLPDDVRDPSDPSGATALRVGKTTFGSSVLTGDFSLRLEGISYTTDPIIPGEQPAKGRRSAVVSATATSTASEAVSLYYLTGGDDARWAIKDSDGETYRSEAVLKASSDEKLNRDLEPGGSAKLRVVFDVPEKAALVTLEAGAAGTRRWAVDLRSAN